MLYVCCTLLYYVVHCYISVVHCYLSVVYSNMQACCTLLYVFCILFYVLYIVIYVLYIVICELYIDIFLFGAFCRNGRGGVLLLYIVICLLYIVICLLYIVIYMMYIVIYIFRRVVLLYVYIFCWILQSLTRRSAVTVSWRRGRNVTVGTRRTARTPVVIPEIPASHHPPTRSSAHWKLLMVLRRSAGKASQMWHFYRVNHTVPSEPY